MRDQTVAGLIQHLQAVVAEHPETAAYEVDMEGQHGISYRWGAKSRLLPEDTTLELET